MVNGRFMDSAWLERICCWVFASSSRVNRFNVLSFSPQTRLRENQFAFNRESCWSPQWWNLPSVDVLFPQPKHSRISNTSGQHQYLNDQCLSISLSITVVNKLFRLATHVKICTICTLSDWKGDDPISVLSQPIFFSKTKTKKQLVCGIIVII